MNDSTLDIKAFLDKDEQKDLLRLLTAGSVDDGKSTLDRPSVVRQLRNYMKTSWTALERDSASVWVMRRQDHIDYALLCWTA